MFCVRYVDPELNNEPMTVREQHFYREGNAEVLQLVTRGQVEDTSQQHHYPTTFIVDGKDVLLQRFMQDQKSRHELQEPETARTVESHQRPKNLYQYQQEILLLPEELEIRHRRAEELDSNAQKLGAMDSDRYVGQKMDSESQARDVHRQEVSINMPEMLSTDRASMPKDQTQTATMQSYAFHDLELARQNVLLTRLLLERETRHAGGGGVMTDAASYLETQSLPGQVAIATQTDRVAATQTERHLRSRSDNDESDEDTRNRKKMKTKKRYGESEMMRTRALWMKSPIEEEESSTNFDKRLSSLRKKVKDVKEGRKVPLEPKVLREISDSLEENGSTCCVREKKMKSTRVFKPQAEESGIGYKVLGEEKNGSSLSTEMEKQQDERTSDEKRMESSLSSPEIKVDNRKYVRETTEKKSTRKESKMKKQKKVESVIKPSFRGLEREITMLTKKLSKFADRKVQQIGSESTSREKSKTSTDSKKDSDESTMKKTEDSKRPKRSETSPSTSKETRRDKFKYQQPQMMSPYSSECEETFEKPKKSKAEFRQEAAKQKQSSSHAKTKKQIERKKQIVEHDRELDKRKDVASKENGKSKIEKAAKLLSRTHKLAAIGRRKRVSEELSTSTSSDRINGTKDPFTARDSDKRSSESSELPSHHANRQQKSRRKLDHVSERFSDDFVAEPRVKDIEEQESAFRPMTDTSAFKENVENGKRNVEISQQFTDDFSLETQTRDVKRPTQAVVETEQKQSATYKFDEEHSRLKETVAIKVEPSVSRESDKDHRVTLREVAEDISVLQDLKSTQPTSVETALETATTRKTESFDDFTMERFEESSKKEVSLKSESPEKIKEMEKSPPHSGKSVVEETQIAHTSEKGEEEKSPHIIKKKMLEKQRAVSETDVCELKISRDTAKKEEEDVSKEGLKITSKEMRQQTEEKHIDGRELHVGTSIKSEKDSTDIKDLPPLHLEKDKTAELDKAESEQKEQSSLEIKERDKETISLTEIEKDSEQKLTEKLVRKEADESLHKDKSDTEEKTKVTAASGYRDAERTEIMKKERTVQEVDSEKEAERDVKLTTTEILEEPSDISRSLKDDKDADDIRRAFSIDDQTLMYIDDSSQEESKDDSEPGKVTDVKEHTDTTKLEYSADDIPAKIKIQAQKIVEEPYASPEETSSVQETKSEEADKGKPRMSQAEIISKAESLDKEQLHDKQTKITQESLSEKRKEETEEISKDKSDEEKEKKGERQDLPVEKKERADEAKETADKEPSEHLPQDLNLEKTAAGEPYKDESETIAAGTDVEEYREKGEQQADVSVPIFSSFIDDTFDVSDGSSDSSSDISRKTTLTARPYDTPRHRQKWQQQESLEIAGMSETTFKDGEDTKMKIEPDEEDTDSIFSFEESENVEESSITIDEIGESKEDTETAVESQEISSEDKKVVSDSDKKDESSKSKVEVIVKPEEHVKKSDTLTQIQDLVVSTLSVKEPNGVSKEKTGKDEIIPVVKEERESEIAVRRANIEEVPETVKKDDEDETELPPSSQIKQIDRKVSKTISEDTVVDKIKIKDPEADKTKSKGSEDGTLSTSEKHDVAKTEPPESSAKKKKKPEQSRTFFSDKKKQVLDKEIKEKPTSSHSRRRPGKSLDLEKQPERDGSQPSQREEELRKITSKTKIKIDKKRTISPKTEIDVSKTQSKYMEWYNKKREEAEKKRLEKKTAEDEEQLPRWASRSLKQTTKRQDTQEHRTPEVTPRTKRKIKPLVNVESEQLKAIVRQGRRLRKAEGSLKKDPPVEIFAGTPPVSISDTHRLQQHSEYKYERIPPPFYLHPPPPPPPHPSPQLSPERSFEAPQPSTSRYEQPEEEICLENVAPIQGGTRLRHQQLLEKKSVFDIAYNEAAPSQLRSDSATPPS